MSVLVNILTTYNGAGAKKAMRDMALMQKQATLAGSRHDRRHAGRVDGDDARRRPHRGRRRQSMSKRRTLPPPVLGFAAAAPHYGSPDRREGPQPRAPAPAAGATAEEHGLLDHVRRPGRRGRELGGKDITSAQMQAGALRRRSSPPPAASPGRPLETVAQVPHVRPQPARPTTSRMLTEASKAANDARQVRWAAPRQAPLAAQNTGLDLQTIDRRRLAAPPAGHRRRPGPRRRCSPGSIPTTDKAGVDTKMSWARLRRARRSRTADDRRSPTARPRLVGLDEGAAERRPATDLRLGRDAPGLGACRKARGPSRCTSWSPRTARPRRSGRRPGDVGRGKTKQAFAAQTAAVDAASGPWPPCLRDLARGLGARQGLRQAEPAARRSRSSAFALLAAAAGPVLVVIGKLTSGIGRMVGVGRQAHDWRSARAARPRRPGRAASPAVTKGARVVRQASAAAVAIASVASGQAARAYGSPRRPRRSPPPPRRSHTRSRPRRAPPLSGSSTPP